MVFSSVTFLFFFLPLVLTGYYLLNLWAARADLGRLWPRLGNFFLLLASLLFYFWGEGFLVWLLVASVLINYAAGRLLSPEKGLSPRSRVICLSAALALDLGFLAYFKYFNFGIDNLAWMLDQFGTPWAGLAGTARVLLPLGISFYTFQAMSYTIDVYQGRVKATGSLIDFACYVTLFPQLVAGPIVRYSDLAQSLTARQLTGDDLTEGVTRFTLGLGKKVLLANTLAVTADRVFALPPGDLTLGLAWLGVTAYTLQIYYDFSGYSDMAIGLGRLFGFVIPENFNYPYISGSVREFWRRWHISLSTWFRDYLYIPLGGNRRSGGRTYFNLILVFFLCGLWHGASWTFVVWGLFHGFFLALERLWDHGPPWCRFRPLGMVYTLMVVLCGWAIFRSESFGQAWAILGAMAGLGAGTGETYQASMYLKLDTWLALGLGVVLSFPVYPRVRGALETLVNWARATYTGPVFATAVNLLRLAGLSALFVASAMGIAAQTYNPFIYFRF